MKRTQNELLGTANEQLRQLMDSDIDPVVNPALHNIDLQEITFSSHLTLTEEEEHLPSLLLHHSDPVLQAYATKHWHRILPSKLDPHKLRPFFAFRPVDIIKKTLANTTQLARVIMKHPQQKHIKSRFPVLNKKRLHEPVSTDRFFANTADVTNGFTCANVFYGMDTTCINVYGHKYGGNGF